MTTKLWVFAVTGVWGSWFRAQGLGLSLAYKDLQGVRRDEGMHYVCRAYMEIRFASSLLATSKKRQADPIWQPHIRRPAALLEAFP